MAPGFSPESRPYRDSSPSTPLSPLSPSALPQWFRHGHSPTAFLTSGRLRLLLIAAGCVALGWVLTSALGTGNEDFVDNEGFYDIVSDGILDDPTGFGDISKTANVQDGIIGELESPQPSATNVDGMHEKELSVSGALADLHQAVKGKIQAWTPYASKSQGPGQPRPSANLTTPGKSHPLNVTALAGEDIKDGINEEERLGARVRIGKCTILFNGNSFWERAIRTHERHDRQHGYRLHVLRQHLLDDVWSKPAYILGLLLRELAKPESDRLEWLFWVDADTIILNPYIPIDVFLPPPGSEFENIHLMYSNDWNGLNNGVFPIRVNQWSVQLFSAITSFRHYRPDVGLQFRDQSAMDMLMKEPAFFDHVAETPQRWFNAYQGEHNETLAPFQIRRGDFLVHFAGVPDREARMGYWLDRAEQHLDDWEIPVKSTSYPQEVRDFWSEQRQKRQQTKDALAHSRLRGKDFLTKIDQDMSDYGDRLGEDQRTAIQALRDELSSMLDSESSYGNSVRMDAVVDRLAETATPLMTIVSSAQKVLLNAAHDAIFAAEKDLLEKGYDHGVSDPDLENVSGAVGKLKQLVIMPQELWNRHDITSATNTVTEARSRIHSSSRALEKGPDPLALLSLDAEGNLVPAETAWQTSRTSDDTAETAEAAAVTVTADPVVVIGEAPVEEQSE